MSLSSVISKFAPALGSVVGSVVPGAGLIINGIASLFGADPSNHEDLANKIKNDPEAYLKLIQFEKDHEAQILDLQIKDRQNARTRELEVIKATGHRDWIVDALTILYTCGFFALMFSLWFLHIPADFKSLIQMMFGAVSSGETVILAFYFGAMNKNNNFK